MNYWKNVTYCNKFQVKLPAVGNSNCLLVKCEIPQLAKPIIHKKSPNYLPKLSSINVHGRKAKEYTSNQRSVKTAGDNLQRVKIMPSIYQTSKNQEYSTILQKYQPRWFKIFSAKYEQKRKRITDDKVSPKVYKKKQNCKYKTLGKKDMKQTSNAKSKVDNWRVKKYLNATKQHKQEEGKNSVVKKKEHECSQETILNTNTSHRQKTVPKKVRTITSCQRSPFESAREKSWRPDKHAKKGRMN